MAVSSQSTIPSTLDLPVAGRFWLAVLLTGIGAGLSGAALTMLLRPSIRADLSPAFVHRQAYSVFPRVEVKIGHFDDLL
jgi:hypothetical protein